MAFALSALFAINNKESGHGLTDWLDQKYKGRTTLLYKGREAIKLALTLTDIPKGSKVGINGLTCYVVYQAVSEAGYKPVFLDLVLGSLNFDTKNLEKNNDLKALIVQNTLGATVDIKAVKSFCRTRNIVLIEDLAHCAGSQYNDGTEAGLNGDFTTLSFSQDKMTDAVSGGALVVRNDRFNLLKDGVKFKSLPLKNQLRDRFYPILTFKIRKLYTVGLGKPFHYFVKKLGILSDPMGSVKTIEYHKLPDWYSYLVLKRFKNIQHDILHRKMISRSYLKSLDKSIVLPETANAVSRSSNVRFPVIVNDRTGLIKYLKAEGVYVSDIWYDAPITPKKLLSRTGYNGECPVSGSVAERILNLPTHINISLKEAERVSALINTWLNTNQK